MPKSGNLRRRQYETLRVLLEYSDEEHGLAISQIQEKLEKVKIASDRRTIYADIDAINETGLVHVQGRRSRGVYYYHVIERLFDPVELRLLVDAVATSRFITKDKSDNLIRKLSSLTSVYEAKVLNRQIGVSGRVKSMNESIFYQVDEISRAMENDRQIRFTYMQWNLEKKLEPRKNNPVMLSPYLLTWNDENYYLIGYVKKDGMLKTYRVDKIRNLLMLDLKREGEEEFRKNDISSYTSESFGMFTRDPVEVQLSFDNEMAGVLIDRFGTDLKILRESAFTSVALTKVEVSRQFFGWLCGLGSGVRIKGPESVKKEYRKYLTSILEDYN